MHEVETRERNETSGRAPGTRSPIGDRGAYACECGYGRCASLIHMSDAEYEGVRAVATHFAIAPNHENPEFEWVISQNQRFAVVEKLLEMPRRIARDTDPRK